MLIKSIPLVVLTSFLITACGGGSSSDVSNPAPTRTEPTAISTENWQSARLLAVENAMENSVEIVGSNLNITIVSDEINQGAHLQIYINSDNKAETGFQFDNEAWEDSGVDFLIEDGDLFKSTANNTGWNWNVNFGAITYSIDTDSATASINLDLLGDVCNIIKVGVMARDEFWDISTFSPASSQMQSFSVAYCNTGEIDNVAPVITLLGANPLILNINDVLEDPGATATDNIDGDITSNIIASSTVNTAIAGNYEISYQVSDAAGNVATLSRPVIVNNSDQDGIVIDGNVNDWSEIPNFSSSANAIMKVSDDEEKLYILVTSSNLGENIQVLMDTDNNVATGLDLAVQISAWAGGADYMIENNSLDKSTSNIGWSWDYGIAPIEYIQTTDTLEIAIKKSDFNELADQIPMGFVSRSESWNVNYVLPEQSLPIYTMQFPNEVNPVTANNDSVTTTSDQDIEIDVLANDSSVTGSALTVALPTQPEIGSATVSENKVTYVPDPLFTGIVNFNYQISDANENTDTASIKVIVTAPPNNAPIADSDIATTEANTPVDIDVLSNDSDEEGDPITIVSISLVTDGTTSLSETGIITYTPNPDFIGEEFFVYTISDGNGNTATGRVQVTVTAPANNDPVANGDAVTTVGINTVQIPVLGNDTDEDGDTLQIVGFTQPSNGSISLSVAISTFNYTPNPTFSGDDSFTYTISDGNNGTATATVTITVPQNNSPDAVEDVAGVFFNQTTTINVLSNDTDPDNDILSVQSIVQPPVGVATLNEDGTIFFDPQNNVGSISIGYTVSDGRGGTDFAILTVSSTDPNDGNDAFPDIENEQVTTAFETSIFINVLANDSDADGDVLILDQVDQGQNGITLKVTQNGVLGVLYTPNPGFVGTDIFYYGVHDGFGHNGAGFVEVTIAPPILE